MKFHLEMSNGAYQIQRYDKESITVNEKVYTHNLIIMPRYLSNWPVESFDTLQQFHFEQVCSLCPQLVLLGTGRQLRFPSTALLVPLIDQGIGVEVMDTYAACRTYSVLVAEGRQVAAAVLLV